MLMGRVARLYYEHGLTHQEIANTLGLSRIRVTRLLAEARASGIVQITVTTTDAVFADEELALMTRLGLRQVWIAPCSSDPEKSDRAFAAVGAEGIGGLLEADTVTTVGVSAAVAAVAQALPQEHIGGEFIPICGSTAGLTTGANGHEIALQFAAHTGGRAHHLPAPLIAASPESARFAAADPGVHDALKRAEHADLLITGLGALDSRAGLLFDAMSPDDHADLEARGAVGDVAGRFFDAEGKAVTGSLDARIVGLTIEQMRGIDRRVGIVRGTEKLSALRTALYSGIFNMLVTDIVTARELLDWDHRRAANDAPAQPR